MNYKDFFKNKNIAVVGLGFHGEMTADIKFLLRLGADVSLHDMHSEGKLRGFLAPLLELGLKQNRLGKIDEDALAKSDLIILSPEVSRKSSFLRKSIEKNIPIEYPDVLFLKLAPPITLIGIMGSCGKSTVAHMVYNVLKRSFSEYEDQGLFFIDPDLKNGALAHLKKIKQGDVVIARIPEEMMSEYYGARISPHVAVITSLTALAEKKSKNAFSILEFQTYNNFIVAPNEVIDYIRDHSGLSPKSKMLRVHDDNQSMAIQVGELFKADKDASREVLLSFSGLKGRGELVKKLRGVEFYNDASSVAPLSTINSLRNISVEKNIVLILGGAYTGYNYTLLISAIPRYAHTVVLLPGSGTLGIREEIKILRDTKYFQARDLEDAVNLAYQNAKKGDRILFSPAFEAIGIHSSRRERGESFIFAVRSL